MPTHGLAQALTVTAKSVPSASISLRVRLLDDPGRRARMGAAARAAAQVFQPGEVARLTLGLYERVTGKDTSTANGKML